MVGVTEEAELERLEKQVEGGGGDVAQYLSLVRKLKVRRSVKVAKHGLALLNNSTSRSKLGVDVRTVYEQVAIAAMDCHALEAAKECIGALMTRFPDSMRVGRLEGAWQQAEEVYSNLLTENPSDTVLHKRRIAMAKAQGNMTGAVEGLNKYLETLSTSVHLREFVSKDSPLWRFSKDWFDDHDAFEQRALAWKHYLTILMVNTWFMADYDAWRELADIYISLQMYKQAAFCFEELVLAQPSHALYHLGYAELLYTLGGIDNLRVARKYYSAAIELSGGKNMRALYGVCLCGAAINQMKGRSRDEKDSLDLLSLAASVIVKEYKEKSPSKVTWVSSIIDKQRVLAAA